MVSARKFWELMLILLGVALTAAGAKAQPMRVSIYTIEARVAKRTMW